MENEKANTERPKTKLAEEATKQRVEFFKQKYDQSINFAKEELKYEDEQTNFG